MRQKSSKGERLSPGFSFSALFIADGTIILHTNAVTEVQMEETPIAAEDPTLSLPHITSKIAYEDAWPDTTITYTVHPNRVKEDIILNKPSAVTSYRTRIEAAGLSPVLLDNRSLQFIDANSQVIFDAPAPFMYDNNKAYSENILYQKQM